VRTIYLLRHAKSSWKDQALADFERPLNKRGRAAAKGVGRHIVNAGMIPAQILCSSAARTRETLARIAKILSAPVPTRYEKGIYLASANVLLRRLRRLDDSLGSVMLIGHNPGMEQLALLLTQDHDGADRNRMALKYPTGALAMVETDVERWADLQPECGRLAAFVTPRDLE